MGIYDTIKELASDSKETMLYAIRTISDFITGRLSDEDQNCLIRCIYGDMSDRHYNEEFAKEDIAKMKVSGNINEQDAIIKDGYLNLEQITAWFLNHKSELTNKAYNVYDFWVTVNMIYSDNVVLLRKWFPDVSQQEMTDKLIELSINWLNDDDNPFGSSKIWSYFNPKK